MRLQFTVTLNPKPCRTKDSGAPNQQHPRLVQERRSEQLCRGLLKIIFKLEIVPLKPWALIEGLPETLQQKHRMRKPGALCLCQS